MLFSQRLPNLLGGVSQAPDYNKAPNEFSTLENVILDTNLKGISKRNGTDYIGNLAAYNHDAAFVQVINRSATERYAAVITNGDLKVFSLINGAEQTVAFPDGKSYLAYSGDNAWRATTVGDSTFLVNRTKQVTKGTTKSPAERFTGLVSVRQAAPGMYYSVTLNGHTVEHVIPKNTHYGPPVVAQVLRNLLEEIPGLSNFRFYLDGATITIESDIEHNYRLKGLDSLGGEAMLISTGSVTSVDELPKDARAGTLLRVIGQPGSTVDDMWVVAETAPMADILSGTTVIWRETVAPDTLTEINDATMPHVLVRNGKMIDSFPVGNFGATFSPPQGFVYGPSDTAEPYSDAYVGDAPAHGGTDDRLVTQTGDGGFTGVIPAGPATATWNWSVDTTNVPRGVTTKVTIALIKGGVTDWSRDFTYLAGEEFQNQTFSIHHVIGENTVASIKLTTMATMDGTQAPVLTIHSSTSAYPGFTLKPSAAWDIQVGLYGVKYPLGSVATLTFPEGAFMQTMDQDKEAQKVAQDFVTAINATGSGWSAELLSETLFPGQHVYLRVSKDGTIPETYESTLELPPESALWSPALDVAAGTLAGLPIRNVTTGASGTVIDNGTSSITFSGLSGGSRTTILPGDEVAVDGLGSTQWIFKKVPWEERKVGDLKLSPWPSFVDRRISDVFYHKGRLGFLTENCIILSAHDSLYRFFRNTVTAVLDSDPIDIESAGGDLNTFESAIEWNTFLVLTTAEGRQYTLTGSPVLSPATAALEHISSYTSQDNCRPLRLGSSLIFAREAAGYTQVREMYEGIYGRLESSLLTEKVSRYIEGDVVDMVGDPERQLMALLTNAGGRNKLYVWQFMKGQYMENVMSSWHLWEFPSYGRIVAITAFEGNLYILAKLLVGGTNRLVLERLNYTTPPQTSEQTRDGKGRAFGSTSVTSRVSFPKFYRRGEAGVAQTEGRTQVRYLKLDYVDSQYMRVTSGGRPYVLDKVSPESGTMLIPIMAENLKADLEIINDADYGFTLSGVEWEALFHSRNKRV